MQGCSCCPWLLAASRGSTTAWGETMRLRVRRLLASVARRGGTEISAGAELRAARASGTLLGGAVAGAREPRGFEEGRPREEHSRSSHTRNRTYTQHRSCPGLTPPRRREERAAAPRRRAARVEERALPRRGRKRRRVWRQPLRDLRQRGEELLRRLPPRGRRRARGRGCRRRGLGRQR